jgi:hypothetical protein
VSCELSSPFGRDVRIYHPPSKRAVLLDGLADDALVFAIGAFDDSFQIQA